MLRCFYTSKDKKKNKKTLQGTNQTPATPACAFLYTALITCALDYLTHGEAILGYLNP